MTYDRQPLEIWGRSYVLPAISVEVILPAVQIEVSLTSPHLVPERTYHQSGNFPQSPNLPRGLL